jgi:hypothetical protein
MSDLPILTADKDFFHQETTKEYIDREDAKRKKVVSIGGEAFVEALAKFGPGETLDFLLRLSGKDWVAQELLTMYPTLVSWSGALKKMTCLEIDVEFLAKKIIEDPDWLKKQGVL